MQERPDPDRKQDGFILSVDRALRFGALRAAYLVAFAALFVLTEFGRKVYRPYIYRNGIDDFGLADVIGNLFGTSVSIFFNLAFCHATPAQGVGIIAFTTLGITIYELLQSILPRGVLDWKDVVSTPIAGLGSLILLLVLWRVVRDPPAEESFAVGTQGASDGPRRFKGQRKVLNADRRRRQ